MTDQPIYAEHGRVHIMIGEGYEREHETCTPNEAREYAQQIIAAADECDRQAEAIRAACVDGHDWGSGVNMVRDWTKHSPVTMRRCNRDGCDASETLDGWAHFAGRLHIDPYTGRRVDCYGPGCENCADEKVGKAIRAMWANASKALAEALDNTNFNTEAAP